MKYFESGVEDPLELAAREVPIGMKRRVPAIIWKGD